MQWSKIPSVLKALRQWINWKLIEDGGEHPRKMPVTPDGRAASSTDPSTWYDFETVARSADRHSGVGYVFSSDDPYTGIDFDGCRVPETGQIEDWAKPWIARLNSYAEVSPSLTGVKVWVRAKLPFETGKKVFVSQPEIVPGKKPAIEVYDHARYFCVTGMRLSGLPPEPQDRQREVDALCKEFFSGEPRDPSKSDDKKSSRLSVIERARRYLDTLPGAVSGQAGHNATFHAACILVLGFCLTKSEALILLSEYNRRCEPPWKEKELQHKIDSADKQPGERGFLRDAREENWAQVKIPEYYEKHSRPTGSAQRSPPDMITLEAAAAQYLRKIETIGTAPLVKLGMDPVDYAVGGGVEPGEMIIVAARPSHGKSAFALQCLDFSASVGIPCAIISEEMSSIALGKRTVQYATQITEQYWLQSLDLVRADVRKHFQVRSPCWIIEGCGSAERAALATRNVVESKGVRVVAVDYAQLLTGSGKSRYEQITQTSIVLRQLASSLNIVILVLCQLSRTIEHRDKFIPRLEDLKDSGQLEQDADVILFLVWPYRLDTHKHPSAYQVWIGKNRNRPINAPEVDCEFNPARQMITASKGSPSGNVYYEPKWNQL
jgi:archaellum biogenesis ATPase FlaH